MIRGREVILPQTKVQAQLNFPTKRNNSKLTIINTSANSKVSHLKYSKFNETFIEIIIKLTPQP